MHEAEPGGAECSSDQDRGDEGELHLFIAPRVVVREAGELRGPGLAVGEEDRADDTIDECDQDAHQRIRRRVHLDHPVGEGSHGDEQCQRQGQGVHDDVELVHLGHAVGIIHLNLLKVGCERTSENYSYIIAYLKSFVNSKSL